MGSAVHSISMKVIAALTTLSILAAPAMSKNMGSINVKDYGEVFVCAPDWAAGQIDMHDNGFTMRGDSRLYFCNRAVDGWDANAYWQTPLMDKHFAYTLDLSNVGCHCNAAAYFIQMPGDQSMILWRVTSTPSQPLFTLATVVVDTGTIVIREVARSTLSMWTLT